MTTPDVTEPGPALTASAAPAAPPPPRDADIVLAGLHLRLGSLALARAELETLAASGRLDRAGRVDLAEARWRTGDLMGAGAAAREAMAGGDASVVTLVVAAEAAAALGRPSEARRLAGLAMGSAEGPIDPVFAGMPRSGAWPADPAEPVPTPATLFPPERATGGSAAPGGRPGHPTRKGGGASGSPATAGSGPSSAAPGSATAIAAAALAAASAANDAEPGFWDIPPVDPASTGDPDRPRADSQPTGLAPADILDAGEAALAAGDYASAALHLGLAVRVAPQIAPAILEAIGDTPDAGLQMVRGDAYRAVGRETDARRAYEAAMAAAGSAEPDPVPPPEGAASERLEDLAVAEPEGELSPDDDSDPFAGET